jgi:nucleoside-diphosphate-sugar epimerase
MRRAVVSGVTGHLGAELARQLVGSEVEVHGITRQEIASNIASVAGVHLHRSNDRTETLVDICNRVRPDTIFHLAGLYRRDHTSMDVAGLVQTNVLFGTQLLEAARLSGCDRFVTAGSYFQHFDSDDYRALNLYAATKQAFEDMLEYYVDAFDMSSVRVTVCDVYSEHDTRRKVMNDIGAAWSGSTSLNFRDEEIWIDPVHVEDAAAAFVQAAVLLERKEIPHRKLLRYSMTSGRDWTSSELVALFERLGDKKLNVTRGKGWQIQRRMKPWRGEVVPGWTPRVSIEEGILRILATRR